MPRWCTSATRQVVLYGRDIGAVRRGYVLDLDGEAPRPHNAGYWGVRVVVFPDEVESVTVKKGGQVLPLSGPVLAGRAVVYVGPGVLHRATIEYTVSRRPGVNNAAAELVLFKQLD